MDLALAMGRSLGYIRSLPESELGLWARYAEQKGLPMRRAELGSALIAKLIAQTMGGAEKVTLQDFLFDPPDESDDSEITDEELEELKNDIGFNPR